MTVLFDCDGVLVDSEGLSKGLLVEMMHEIGIDKDPAELLYAFSGRRMAECLTEINSWLGSPLPDTFQDEYRQREYALLKEHVTAIPGIEQAIDGLTETFAVASNGPMEKIRTTLDATGLLPRFGDHVYSAYDINCFKPDPGLYLHAAERTGSEIDECVVVEDSVFGAKAGLAAGMRVVGYGPYLDDLTALGVIPLADMAQLPALLASLE